MDGKLRAGASLLSHSGAGVDGGEELEEQKKRRVVGAILGKGLTGAVGIQVD